MPGSDHHHGPHGPGPFPGPRGGWGGPWDGPSPWLGVLALLAMLLALGALLRATGYDRVLAERLRALLGRGSARDRWQEAVARHERTAVAFAAFECEPAAALARPALADVAQPATARFVEAFAEACALRTERYPGPEAAEAFALAAERSERAWTAAVDAADRVRAARFAPGERALLDRTVALLSVARETVHDGERHAAYRRARERLAELERRTGWRLPRPAADALEQRARGALLPAG